MRGQGRQGRIKREGGEGKRRKFRNKLFILNKGKNTLKKKKIFWKIFKSFLLLIQIFFSFKKKKKQNFKNFFFFFFLKIHKSFLIKIYNFF